MDDDIIAFREDEVVLPIQSVRDGFDQFEQPLAARFDVGAVLYVGRRPELPCGVVVALVEQRVERLQHECLVLFLLGHLGFFLS